MNDRDILAEIAWRELAGPGSVGEAAAEISYSAGKVADIAIRAGWRPPARGITTAADLEALPIGSVILLEYGVVAQAVGGEEDIRATGWMGIGHDLQWTSAQVVEYAGRGASFAVLYVPETGDTE